MTPEIVAHYPFGGRQLKWKRHSPLGMISYVASILRLPQSG